MPDEGEPTADGESIPSSVGSQSLTVEVDADTGDAEEAIDGVTAAVHRLAGALDDVDAAMRRIEDREISISIELQPRSADDTGDDSDQ